VNHFPFPSKRCEVIVKFGYTFFAFITVALLSTALEMVFAPWSSGRLLSRRYYVFACIAVLTSTAGQLDLNNAPNIKGLSKKKYPQNALRCMSTLTAPFGNLICPEFA
jgi:hypothetical protein